MRHSPNQRKRRDIAYICFLIPGACAVLGTIGSLLISGLDIEPGYFGFFVLVPILLISVVALPVAMVLTLIVGRRDPALIALFVASILVFVAGVTGLGGDLFAFNIAPILYGVLVVVLGANWFVVRRKACNESDTAA